MADGWSGRRDVSLNNAHHRRSVVSKYGDKRDGVDERSGGVGSLKSLRLQSELLMVTVVLLPIEITSPCDAITLNS